jgi:nucleotide-binding universal stress UspA family protein
LAGIILARRVRIERGVKPMSIFPTTFLLATDGSREAELAATTAAEMAKSTDSELHVLHVGEVPVVYHPERHGYRVEYEEHEKEAQQLLEAQVERIKGAGATVGQAHLRMGRPDEEIVDLAQSIGAGLIVMGSRGRGRIRRALMGSVSESVVRHAHCPVTIVRQ